MSESIHSAVLLAVMALFTALLRFLPFLIFHGDRKVPVFIVYLGNMLPQAIIGMLVIYCLRDVRISTSPFGLPELIAAVAVVALQIWRKNLLISILSGTALYMALLRLL